eukprot:3972610-Pyramimonas_sp.AAC.1
MAPRVLSTPPRRHPPDRGRARFFVLNRSLDGPGAGERPLETDDVKQTARGNFFLASPGGPQRAH